MFVKTKLSAIRPFRYASLCLMLMGASACGTDTAPELAAPGKIGVNDVHATYPVSIDALSWLQQAQLLASDGAASDYFGISVAISGDTAIVGAYRDNVGMNTDQGSAYVYVRNGMTWTEQAKLLANDGAAIDYFGRSVAIAGDTAVVGAWADDVGAIADQGSAYVFVRNGTTWTQQAQLIPSNGAIGDAFGYSVAIAGDTVLVGSRLDDVGANMNQGSAYVFVRNAGTWTEQAQVVAADGLPADEFGFSVSISGDTALIAAREDDIGANLGQGSAYVFVRNGTTWTQQTQLLANDGAAFDYFGNSVSISADTALVGAHFHDVGANTEQGAAYVFVRNGTTWAQQTQLLANDGATSDSFGFAVSISGDTALVSARSDDVGANMDQGSAYVFVRNGSTWTQQAQLVASDGLASDLLGSSVGLSGNTAVVGAEFDVVAGNTSRGSASVFVVDAPKSNGEACVIADECQSGFCADGVCCNTACGSSLANDCQACSMAAGAPANGTCAVANAGTVCRGPAGVCDIAETCDGTSNVCPNDTKVVIGTECRASTGACDVAETCDGATNDCPIDTKSPNGSSCNGGMCNDGQCVGDGGSGGAGTGGSSNGGVGGMGGMGGDVAMGGAAGTGNEPTDPGACGCRVVSSSSGSLSAAWSLLGWSWIARRRRRPAKPRSA